MRVAMPMLHCWNRVPGGTARASIELARAVAQRGEVDVVAVKPTGVPMTPELESLGLDWAELGPPRLPVALLYDAWAYTPMFPVERAFGRGSGKTMPDLVHFTAPLVPGGGRLPVTATLHDVFPLSAPETFTARGRRLMSRSLRHLSRRATQIGCSSQATRAECIQLGFDRERLTTIPLGVRVEPSDAQEAPDRMGSGLADRFDLRRPFVLWVGTLEPRKNLAAVLSLAPMLDARGTDLVLVGPDGWSGAADQVNKAVAAGRGAIKWLGRVETEDLAALYAEAQLFVFPSLAEGFGLPVVEAMAHGTAVVTSRGTATEEAGGGCVALVDPHDHVELGHSVQRLLDDAAERSRMAEAGLVHAAAQTWDRCAAAYEQMWAQALHQDPANPSGARR